MHCKFYVSSYSSKLRNPFAFDSGKSLWKNCLSGLTPAPFFPFALEHPPSGSCPTTPERVLFSKSPRRHLAKPHDQFSGLTQLAPSSPLDTVGHSLLLRQVPPSASSPPPSPCFLHTPQLPLVCPLLSVPHLPGPRRLSCPGGSAMGLFPSLSTPLPW